MTIMTWQRQAEVCRDILNSSVPKQWLASKEKLPKDDQHDVSKFPYEAGTMTEEELMITEQDGASLLKHYAEGTWSVEQVTTAFLKRAVLGHQLLNFATEFLAETALDAARALDAYFRETGSLRGPLHGIPISVKEHVAIGGRVCNAGFVSKWNHIASEDAHVVRLLKNAGAIIHVRTNQPQSLMHLDCDNNITGRTLNPFHRLLSPGGSSGGEGASIGFRCAVIGIGTDIGGSVRAPAAFNDCYGLKPTALRIPSYGLNGISAGQESIRGCVGPLARSLSDITLFQKAVLDQAPWDFETSLVPLPWKALSPSRKPRIGVMMDDGQVTPHPPILRALDTVRRRLGDAGFETVLWEPYKHDHGWHIVSSLYMPDAGQRLRETLQASGEPELPLTTWAISQSTPKPLSVMDNWSLNFEREKYRREYHALMKKTGVDVILCPIYPGAGVLQGGAKYWGYTSVWNCLDQPAIAFPSGLHVDQNIDRTVSNFQGLTARDIEEQKHYEPSLFHGISISLQLVGKHHKDEELIEALGCIESALGQSRHFR